MSFSVNVKYPSFSSIVNQIKHSEKGKKLLSLNSDPMLKEDIYTQIAMASPPIITPPEETTALKNSPLQDVTYTKELASVRR